MHAVPATGRARRLGVDGAEAMPRRDQRIENRRCKGRRTHKDDAAKRRTIAAPLLLRTGACAHPLLAHFTPSFRGAGEQPANPESMNTERCASKIGCRCSWLPGLPLRGIPE